ncbi:hypothetical protein PV08_06888 [Exophiala spinifera]|uniref:Transcriptional activator of proteases prtT n=1 Tax=Exophiala spinifera TaxID=91928 RepID=A0A0D1ZMR1_9EURO|nr:uncharacterized protein PV08_06888 [Exophiala spinifera]KIW14107.1 hypothetical protein PV08_06888 [Exophiala spinifera]
MPPLRAGRASKACDACRKQKTRCYTSDNNRGVCLRCETLSQPCSLESSPSQQSRRSSIDKSLATSRDLAVDARLERLENTVQALVERLDQSHGVASGVSPTTSNRPQPRLHAQNLPEEKDSAPVLLIRDAAAAAGVRSPDQGHTLPKRYSDVISSGLVSLKTAHTLMSLFHVHYGRWVKFAEDITTETLLLQVRRSPLLLCSILLIAVRHTTQELADSLAPALYEEAKSLVAPALLTVPQSTEFFQAALILSLWSTTIGQVPLSIDSWLLTGYAIQQSLASPYFNRVFQEEQDLHVSKADLDAWCIWNHLCVAHLQYCVGTRRQALLNQAQIDQCLRFLESDNVTNFEARMVAEVQLYWIIYDKCYDSDIDSADTKRTLQEWQREWAVLFNQPRSQFLQMGFHFAHLLAYCQSLKSTHAVMRLPLLIEMIQLSKSIINLAMDTTDERTRHLTDHIYHVITFSALTLCRLVHTYESKLRAARQDIEALDHLVMRLISWFKTIGLPCHAAHILGNAVSAQFKKLRPAFQPELQLAGHDYLGTNDGTSWSDQQIGAIGNNSFVYPDFIGSELFDVNASSWPQWDMILSDADMSV